MTRNENSDDRLLKTSAKRLKVQISHSDMWADVFYYKLVTAIFFIFIEKYRKKTLCLNIKPVYRKRVLGFDEKENYDIEKSFI